MVPSISSRFALPTAAATILLSMIAEPAARAAPVPGIAPRLEAPAQNGVSPRAVLDPRTLRAVTDLRRLISGDATPALATFERDRWRIRCGASEVGTLPERPSYQDVRRLLFRQAVALGAREKCRADASLRAEDVAVLDDALRAASPAEVLARIDGLTHGRRDPRAIRLASRSLVLLNLQCLNAVDAAEPLSARALAVVALATALDSAATVRDECLLADALGEGEFARGLATGLDPSDPTRAFVLREDTTLAGLASRTNEPEAVYLMLVRLGRRHGFDDWARWTERYFSDGSGESLPVLATALQLERRDAALAASRLVLVRVTDELRAIERVANARPSSEPSLASLIAEFEALQERMPPTSSDALLDREVARAYYRSHFFAALSTHAERDPSDLASIQGTKTFAEAIGHSEGGSPTR